MCVRMLSDFQVEVPVDAHEPVVDGKFAAKARYIRHIKEKSVTLPSPGVHSHIICIGGLDVSYLHRFFSQSACRVPI